MKILVVYSSRIATGNTKKVAEAIAARLGCPAWHAEDAPDPDDYDFIALGFGVYRGWPEGDMRAYMKKCKSKNVGLFMTLGAWPDSTHAATAMGRAEGLLDSCTVKARFICQGGYTQDFLEHLKSLPPGNPHGWTPERAERILEAMKHPDRQDLDKAADTFAAALEKWQNAPHKAKEEKRAIAAVFFGTTIPSAAKSYDIIEEEICKTHPGIPVFRAYTSGKVRRKLGGKIPSLSGLLRRLAEENYTKVSILAGFLSSGEMYHELLRDASAFKREMEIRITRPPLSGLRSLREFIPCAIKLAEQERNGAENVLFMGHGNSDGRSDFTYRILAEELKKKDPDHHLACVEGLPSLESVIPELRPGRVLLVPFMLAAGDHAINDMAGNSENSWKTLLTNRGFACKCILKGLGEEPLTAEYYAGQLKKIWN